MSDQALGALQPSASVPTEQAEKPVVAWVSPLAVATLAEGENGRFMLWASKESADMVPLSVGDLPTDAERTNTALAGVAVCLGVNVHGLPASLAPETVERRCVEVIAAIISAATQTLDFLRSAPLESGVCCCGDPVEGHGYGSGHSPVDDLAYHASQVEKTLQAAITKATGESQ